MLTPSVEVLPWLALFASSMTAPSFHHLLVLFTGTVLTPGARTVTAALRVLGVDTGNFSQYHSFFNRARWCPMLLSRLLLALLIRAFLAPGAPLIVLVDEHLERRRARKLAYRGLYRDPVRSAVGRVVLAWGIRWLVFALLVPVPWSRRGWALPFLVLPLLNEKLCQRLKRKHHTVVEVTGWCIGHLRRWQPERPLVLVGDGTYAAVPLANRCRNLQPAVTFVSRLRLDAALHAFPAPRAPGQRGKTPTKGPRLPKLSEVLTDPHTVWRRVSLCWYGQETRTVEVATGEALWYRGGQAPTPLRWVLVRSPEGEAHPITPGACFSTERAATPEQLLAWFIGRWNIEVTFAEIRAHLGFETQRYWSRQATGRVTPCLFGAFSLVVLIAKELHPERLPVPQSAWYPKEEATFADALAAVRRYLWQVLSPPPVRAPWREMTTWAEQADVALIPGAVWRQLQQVACYAT
jgi:hypothetical protein